jgi:hypothetical protein
MRPLPPLELARFSNVDMIDRFEPSPELRDWIVDTFIAEEGELANPDHAHLMQAEIGVLWTNADNSRHMRQVIGQAEIMPPLAMGKWQRARACHQIEEWFGLMPDFLLTFSAPAADGLDDASFCALVEHELYHCAQARDVYGMPKFNREGQPVFSMRGHDVEEFVGVVARYGSAATGVAEMVEAAADIAGACGTCSLKAA